ncbi:unnamed protein product, partial [Arabidopsis halleri]
PIPFFFFHLLLLFFTRFQNLGFVFVKIGIKKRHISSCRSVSSLYKGPVFVL